VLFAARSDGSVLPRVLARGSPLVDGSLRALRAVRPPLSQSREGQIAREPTAAEPHGAVLPRGSKRNGIAGYDVVASGGEPGTDEHAAATEAADELALVDGCDRCGTHGALEAVSVDLDAPLPIRPGTLAGLHSPLAHAQLAGLQRHQTVLALEFATHFLRALEVVVRGRFREFLAHERDGDVHVIVAVLGQPVSHGNPPAGGLARLFGEPHTVDELLRDRAPLLIAQLTLVGAQRQRAVPHVGRDALGVSSPVCGSSMRT
jgi:hypothetical protein